MPTLERTCVNCGKLESDEPGGEFGGGSGGPWCSDCMLAEGQRSAQQDLNGQTTVILGQAVAARSRLPKYVSDPTSASSPTSWQNMGYDLPWCTNCTQDLEAYDMRQGRWRDAYDVICARHPDPNLDHHVPTFARPTTSGPPQGDTMTQAPELDPAIAQMIQTAVQNAIPQASVEMTFDEILEQVDPRDSEAALAMLDWLLRNQRLHRLGVLDGDTGYLFAYREPKGSSKQGYAPGATQGDRIVDAAVDQQRQSGATALKKGMCPQCYSAVRLEKEGDVLLDDDTPGVERATCSATGESHGFVS